MMDTHNYLAEQFEAERSRSRAMAYRMPGSLAEAENADTRDLELPVVLDTLAPAERITFVLHDIFAVQDEGDAHLVKRGRPERRITKIYMSWMYNTIKMEEERFYGYLRRRNLI